MSEINILQKEIAETLDELYTSDICAESIMIDGRSIPGSLTLAPSPVELISGGWSENVTAIFTTLKQYFPTGKWPRVEKSKANYSVNGVVKLLQVRQVQGSHDQRAQMLIGFSDFGNAK